MCTCFVKQSYFRELYEDLRSFIKHKALFILEFFEIFFPHTFMSRLCSISMSRVNKYLQHLVSAEQQVSDKVDIFAVLHETPPTSGHVVFAQTSPQRCVEKCCSTPRIENIRYTYFILLRVLVSNLVLLCQ